MKILAFGASNSMHSINRQFAAHTASQFENSTLELLDMSTWDLPIFSIERESESGHPKCAIDFVCKIKEADLLIISLAEYNGSYTSFFKNLFDWSSRVKLKMFEDKKMILLSTAPGPRGGKSVMEAALTRFPIHGAEIIGHFILPKFKENFIPEMGIVETELKEKYQEMLDLVKSKLMEQPSLES